MSIFTNESKMAISECFEVVISYIIQITINYLIKQFNRILQIQSNFFNIIKSYYTYMLMYIVHVHTINNNYIPTQIYWIQKYFPSSSLSISSRHFIRMRMQFSFMSYIFHVSFLLHRQTS